MVELTEKRKKILEESIASAQQKEAFREAVPTQRLRTMAQGATLGFADELEARAQALLTGKTYDEAVEDIRSKLAAYQEARPIEATAYEVGGALAPALLPGGQASLLRAAGRGAVEGGIYAFGTGEGDVAERAARIPGGVVGGGLGGGAGYGVGKAISKPVNALADAARRMVGGRGSTIVENEIQRLTQQTGKTPDEIAQDIIEGRLLAENKTIRAAVRSLRAKGGEASTILEAGLMGRPEKTRAAAMEEMKRYLGEAEGSSQAAARRASEQATREAEQQAYGAVRDVTAPQNVVDELKSTLKRVPSAAKEVEIALQAETGKKPFFTISEAGDVIFDEGHVVTVGEAESIRRAVANRASALYRQESMGGAGQAVAGVEKELRSVLDFSVPELTSARAQAAAVRANRDAYEAGTKAMAGDVNQKLADFAELQQGKNADEAVAAFRAGFLQAMEARAATGSRQSMIRNLANEETKEGMLLRQIFPQDQLGEVLRKLDVASEAQAAQSFITGGSPTSETLLEASRQGMGIGAAELAGAASLNPADTLSVASKLIGRFTRSDLTDAERARIARILVSQDPNVVRNALVDESGMQKFADTLATIMRGLQAGSRTGTATQAGEATGASTSGLMK
jgi:hypothetical protein